MEVLLTLLIIIASVLLVAVVLIQNPKGGGLSSNFGAPSQLGGVQRANDFVVKATWTLAGAIAVLTLVMVMMNSGPTGSGSNRRMHQVFSQQKRSNKPYIRKTKMRCVSMSVILTFFLSEKCKIVGKMDWHTFGK
jgi:preprotein translocase subunit SecG